MFPGDALGGARAKLIEAQRNLAAQVKASAAYYAALKDERAAEVALAAEIDNSKDVLRELGQDLTNPIVKAQDALITAREKLARDIKNGASRAVLNQDKLAVKEAGSSLGSTTFSTNLQAAQTNFEIGRNAQFAGEQGRLTYRQYLDYLKNERTRLLDIKQRTYEQQQELNQVDQAILAAQSQLSGQFNLGDIKLPTVYEVRRSLQENPFLNPGKLTEIVQDLLSGHADSTVTGDTAAPAAAPVTALQAAIKTLGGDDTAIATAKLVALVNAIKGVSTTGTVGSAATIASDKARITADNAKLGRDRKGSAIYNKDLALLNADKAKLAADSKPTTVDSFNFQKGFDSVVQAVDRLSVQMSKGAVRTTATTTADPNALHNALAKALGATSNGTRTTKGRKV